MSIRRKVSGVLKTLSTRGYFAKGNWKCCQTCGCAAIPKGEEDKYVFYHGQDADAASDGYDLHLAFGTETCHGHEIVALLKDAGLTVEWDGTMSQRICVKNTP
jgi:hypothetical protein